MRNFETNFPLTHESAAQMVADQHAAERKSQERAREALRLFPRDRVAALGWVLEQTA